MGSSLCVGYDRVVRRHVQALQSPKGYRRPPRRLDRPLHFSEEEKRDIVWLIDQGWWPLDVAVAYDIPIYTQRAGWQTSLIYGYYQEWKDRYGEARE